MTKSKVKKQSDDNLWDQTNVTYEYNSEFEVHGGSGQNVTYDIGDLEQHYQLDLFNDEDMREKYPALKQAHEHYQSILEICKTKEKESDEN